VRRERHGERKREKEREREKREEREVGKERGTRTKKYRVKKIERGGVRNTYSVIEKRKRVCEGAGRAKANGR
jgi:hypothetical protein